VGFLEWGDSCVSCEATKWGLGALLFFASWAYTLFLHLTDKQVGDIGVFLYYVQTAVQIIGSDISWLTVFAFFSLNLNEAASGGGSSGSGCLTPVQPLVRVVLEPCGVLLMFAQLALIMLFHWLLEKNPAAYAVLRCLNLRVFSVDNFIQTGCALLLFSFTTVGTTVVKFFHCVDVDGERVLYAVPSVNCDSAEYRQYLPLAIMWMLLFVVAAPLVLTAHLIRNRGIIREIQTERDETKATVRRQRAARRAAHEAGKRSMIAAAAASSHSPRSPSHASGVAAFHSSSTPRSRSPAPADAAAADSLPGRLSAMVRDSPFAMAAAPASAAAGAGAVGGGSVLAVSASDRRHSKEERDRFIRRWSLLFFPYSTGGFHFLYQIAVLLRRMVCVVTDTFLAEARRNRLIAFFFIHFFCYLQHLISTPYRAALSNFTERLSFLFLMILAFLLISDGEFPIASTALSIGVFLILTALGFLSVVLGKKILNVRKRKRWGASVVTQETDGFQSLHGAPERSSTTILGLGSGSAAGDEKVDLYHTATLSTATMPPYGKGGSGEFPSATAPVAATFLPMARLTRTAQPSAPSVAGGGEHSRTSMAASSVHYHTQSMASFSTIATPAAAGGAESAMHRRAASHMSPLRETDEASESASGSVEMTSNPDAIAMVTDSAVELADLRIFTNPLASPPAAHGHL
jgi:hypothetical protein